MTNPGTVRLVYFAWVRERVGMAEEMVSLPADVLSVADLLAWQQGRGENYAYAFDHAPLIRTAVDKAHAKHDTQISGAREIAFFPPMTGG